MERVRRIGLIRGSMVMVVGIDARGMNWRMAVRQAVMPGRKPDHADHGEQSQQCGDALQTARRRAAGSKDQRSGHGAQPIATVHERQVIPHYRKYCCHDRRGQRG